MKTFMEFLFERSDHGLPRIPWEKNPKIGWWKDGSHLTMYHGTHETNLHRIDRDGIKAPEHGPTKGWVSMTHDPHTAHGYASMSGGESAFRAAGGQARHVPDHERSVLVAHIPREWAEKHMNHHMRGNIGRVADNMTDRDKYDRHVTSGRPDHEYYATTELRFKDRVPREFIKGYMKKKEKE